MRGDACVVLVLLPRALPPSCQGDASVPSPSTPLPPLRDNPILFLYLTPIRGIRSLPQSNLPGSKHRLGAINNLQLAEDVGHMVADGLRAEHQILSNLGIAFAHSDQSQDFPLAFRQVREGGLRQDGLHIGKILHQPLSDGWAKDGLSMSHHADGPEYLGLVCPFE